MVSVAFAAEKKEKVRRVTMGTGGSGGDQAWPVSLTTRALKIRRKKHA
jgi:hypothetical protein